MAPSFASRAAFTAAVAGAFLRRMFHGILEAAFRFDERFFAIHHAGPGHFAEFGQRQQQ